MGSGAAEMMFRGVFEGSISMQDCLIERRPYHRNCQCALHNLKGICSSTCSSRTTNISFPKKQTWGDCSLSLSAPKFSSPSPLLPNASFTNTLQNIDSTPVLYEAEGQHS
ncbi:hypothetical protein ERO13_D06G049025v2 [Gossypium hirsutum]|uniref:Uncharacterized protein n=5 Tax=Gossypium TaxID=3633 RepID=A0A1U8IT00_GOSHI|nr:uncharacterized protein LOC107900010 [Gossypium hirsutum]KAB2023971.1 hypothetical protein ES319_D06G056000v1 [Gossypium barbadense]TYG63830.1 hypothetical protein ES288_D06G060700v1 [Gossypium darwinii]TYI76157.1 hypothetical protein E1A91_D06G057100v1 [Gossypium mustelinum]KAG4140956.1 hypothetical protein ERO13_D06G049025v2 [Gossypium hirsutum]PPD98269.1 hypothetical protein GOBAR_DD04696 [Gossypium barbadense]